MQPGNPAAPPGTTSRVLTTADVLAELLDAAARVRAGGQAPPVPAPPPAPTPPAPPPGPVPLARLMGRDGSGFVEGAYADLFGRDPDPDALAHYRDELVGGRMSKAAILGVLLHSPEGRRGGRHVPGLRRRLLVERAQRAPVFGPVLRAGAAVLALPRLVRELRRLEQQAAVDRERIEWLERAAIPAAAVPAAGGPGR